jgi:hypothetical protein
MVLSPSRLWPLTDCTTNYRPVLSSERAYQDEEQSNCPAKERKKERFGHGPQRGALNQDGWAPKGCPKPRLTVGRNISSTQLNSWSESPCGGVWEYFHRNSCKPLQATEREPSSIRRDSNESSATLISDRLHYKSNICPLVREGAPRRRAKQLSGKRKEKEKSGHGPPGYMRGYAVEDEG